MGWGGRLGRHLDQPWADPGGGLRQPLQEAADVEAAVRLAAVGGAPALARSAQTWRRFLPSQARGVLAVDCFTVDKRLCMQLVIEVDTPGICPLDPSALARTTTPMRV